MSVQQMAISLTALSAALDYVPCHNLDAFGVVKEADLSGQLHVVAGGDTGMGQAVTEALASAHADIAA